MKTTIVLAMHGAPPSDFPRDELRELMGLHARIEHASGPELEGLKERHDDLEEKMRAWPRTRENDPYFAGSMDLAEAVHKASVLPVVVGFNEFCGPSLDEAIATAIEEGAERIIVVTPMMTRGGGHSEKDIPQVVERARRNNPEIDITYVWPLDIDAIGRFLAEQVRSRL